MMREAMEERAVADWNGLVRRCDRISTAAERCARIVRSFLDMARQRETERTPTRLETVVEEAVELLGYTMGAAGITVERRWADTLPVLFLDSSQIHQVVLNLLVNAQQALEQAGGADRKIVVGITVDQKEGMVALTIDDNGPGVPEAIRSRIFDPFFTTKPQGAGTGIGLAVSKGLVEAHGGSLTLGDAPDGGARFVIRLPNEPVQTGEARAAQPATGKPQPAPYRQLLVVDDDVAIAELLAEIAGRLGYAVTVTHGGNEARGKISARDGKFDAILCDIRMPAGDGPGLYDWLCEHHPALSGRSGFVTGDTLGPLAGRFLARSGCPMIEKPFTPADIAAFLDDLTMPR